MAAGGDGRDSSVPLFVSQVVATQTTSGGVTTTTYAPATVDNPTFVTIGDGGNEVELVPDGNGKYGLPMIDTPVRRLLEKILLVQEDIRAELTKLNGGK